MKYAFIQRHRHTWPVSVQCRVLRVSSAGYRAHLALRPSAAQRRHLSDEALLVHIKALHAQTRGAYGWPRIWRELVARGLPVGKQRVQKLMQLHGIRAKGKRGLKVNTQQSQVADFAQLAQPRVRRSRTGQSLGRRYHVETVGEFKLLLASVGQTERCVFWLEHVHRATRRRVPQRFVTRRHARDETIGWMLWFNKARLHSTLAYVSPMQFESEWLARQANA